MALLGGYLEEDSEMLEVFVVYAVTGSKADVTLHSVKLWLIVLVKNIPRLKRCTDGTILFLVLQLQETMVQGAVEEVVDMEGGAVTEFFQACHG